MSDNKNKSTLDDARTASIVGAREDIIHVSEYAEGYDLRAHAALDGIKQKVDENGNT
ncbi:hypothetical protein [Bacillus suaedaesalsae]|uniref:DUF4025 domain-containing protein n=1 Tax=Bacillus suaedaesalsae TaxID=2810349 RepID=A0ABS2DJS6_9BACI|nr:hypothetical protein [Bacillus suaedaesalsae]MBM6618719.1 hypothetical protein [Bacillus suaedaesalsae]